MKRLLLSLALLALVAAALAVPAARAEPVAVVVSGPTAVAPSSSHPYTIKVTGGPAAAVTTGATYTINYMLQGDNTVGGDPVILRTLANAKGEFVVNLTAPSSEGTVQFYVKGTSSDGSANETTETRYTIHVALPIELRATLRNNGAATATNVTVYFYVDGTLVGNTTVARLAAGAQVDVNFTYVPVGLAEGQHTVKITADLDHDGTIEPEGGELLQESFFYKSGRSVAPAIFATVTVFILVILVFVLLAIRRQRRQG